jgi:hypothetical protein
MLTLRVAEVKYFNLFIELVLLEYKLDNSLSEHQSLRIQIEMHAVKQGFRGLAIPIWEVDGGRVGFLPPPITPKEWVSFIESLSWAFVEQKVNEILKIPDV